jgi:hypothetical protein
MNSHFSPMLVRRGSPYQLEENFHQAHQTVINFRKNQLKLSRCNKEINLNHLPRLEDFSKLPLKLNNSAQQQQVQLLAKIWLPSKTESKINM